MSATHRRRAVVLGSALIAASVVLGPVSFQQAAAAAPSETHAGTSAKVPQSDRDYQRGFKDGFKDGFKQGHRGCDHNGRGDHGGRSFPGDHMKPAALQQDLHKDLKQDARKDIKKDSGNDYNRGYKDGFKSGFKQGHRNC
ncbi:hypothetical protein ACFPC0_13265 [Streptomyces andamanensis]|uniref:Uncharacterized protein n=1 Tax=Streptomyces andamanensis TaxID=1565035 RepID=A0ABV8TDT1_9ACTN